MQSALQAVRASAPGARGRSEREWLGLGATLKGEVRPCADACIRIVYPIGPGARSNMAKLIEITPMTLLISP